MLFLPNDDALEAQAKAITEAVVAEEGLSLLGWRQVGAANEADGGGGVCCAALRCAVRCLA
jgi:glutamate synthase domain-containing protein 1